MDKHKTFTNVESILIKHLKLINYVLIRCGFITTLSFHAAINRDSDFSEGKFVLRDVRKPMAAKSQQYWSSPGGYSHDTGLFSEHASGRKKSNVEGRKTFKFSKIFKLNRSKHVAGMQKDKFARNSEEQPPDYSDLFDAYVYTESSTASAPEFDKCKQLDQSSAARDNKIDTEFNSSITDSSEPVNAVAKHHLSAASQLYIQSALKRNPKLLDALYDVRDYDVTNPEYIFGDECKGKPNGKRKSVSFDRKDGRVKNDDPVEFKQQQDVEKCTVQGSRSIISSGDFSSRCDSMEQFDFTFNKLLEMGGRHQTDDFECYFELELASIATGKPIAIVRHPIKLCSQFTFFGNDMLCLSSGTPNSRFINDVIKAYESVTNTITKCEKFQTTIPYNFRHDLPLLRKYTMIGVVDITHTQYDNVVRFVQNTFQVRLRGLQTNPAHGDDFTRVNNILLQIAFELYRRNKKVRD